MDRITTWAAALLAGATALAAAGCAARTPAPSALTIGLGQQGQVGPVRIKPLKVEEDSRCPADALCVWAGQVRLTAAVSGSGPSRTLEFTSGKPVMLGRTPVTLVQVCPVRMRDRTIAPADYRFTFSIEEQASGAPQPCG